jgi:hypothetical protein
MRISEETLEQMNSAEYVRVYPEHEFVVLYNGSLTFNVMGFDGRGLNVWTISDERKTSMQVLATIKQYIDEKITGLLSDELIGADA